jgi:hypothetical protein
LKEVFREGMSTEDFVRRRDGKKFLTTHKLRGITERCLHKEGKLPEATQLRHARNYLRAYCGYIRYLTLGALPVLNLLKTHGWTQH